MKGLLFFLCLVCNVAAQIPSSVKDSSKEVESIVKIKAIVEEINNLKLLKIQFRVDPDYADVYFDEQRKIRKVIMYGGYPESGFFTIENFDEEGDICHLIFEGGDAENRGHYCPENSDMYSHYGNAYFNNGEVIAFESKYECSGTDHNSISVNTIMPEESGYLYSGYHKNTQRLKELLGELIFERGNGSSSDIEIRKSTNLFCFCKDSLEVDDYVVINANDVIIREEPDVKSGKKDIIDSGTKAEIKEIGDLATIGKYGTHRWYKITYWNSLGSGNGWIFGALIEPVYFEYE